MSPGLNWAVVDNKRVYADHLGATANLFQAAFHRDFPKTLWNQYYFNNPYGDPIVSLAYSGSTLVAHQALVPSTVSDGSLDIRYHLSMSTMVHPAHRGMPVFIELFKSVHRHALSQASGFVLGFPNASLYAPLGRCFGYRAIVESPLRNWVPPDVEPATISQDPALGQPLMGHFTPPFTTEYWAWRTKLNQARAVVVNDGIRIVYKLLGGGTLNVLDVELPGREATWRDLAGLAAAEGCRSVRITDHHASMLGLAGSELTSHEGYSVRMCALPLNQPVPQLQFNLLFCDIF